MFRIGQKVEVVGIAGDALSQTYNRQITYIASVIKKKQQYVYRLEVDHGTYVWEENQLKPIFEVGDKVFYQDELCTVNAVYDGRVDINMDKNNCPIGYIPLSDVTIALNEGYTEVFTKEDLFRLNVLQKEYAHWQKELKTLWDNHQYAYSDMSIEDKIKNDLYYGYMNVVDKAIKANSHRVSISDLKSSWDINSYLESKND